LNEPSVLNPIFAVFWTVNCKSWPKDFGSPSEFGLQIYAGTREPLVKATAGAAVSRTAKIILWICIIFIIGRARMIDIGSLGAIVLLQMNGEISFV